MTSRHQLRRRPPALIDPTQHNRRPQIIAAVETAAVGADDGVRLDRLRVDHARTRLRIPPGVLADLAAEPVVELADQAVVAPASEERVDPVPGREVRQGRPAT